MNQQYPFITFLQKSQQDEGQAKSLNMLLGYAQPYTYWFHWEEGWEPTRPFLNNAFGIMDTTNITNITLMGYGRLLLVALALKQLVRYILPMSLGCLRILG